MKNKINKDKADDEVKVFTADFIRIVDKTTEKEILKRRG